MNLNIENIQYFYLCNESNKISKSKDQEGANELIRTGSDKKLFLICQGCFKFFENTFLGDIFLTR